MNQEFEEAIVRDPRVFKQNTMPAHSDHLVCQSWEEQEKGVSGFRWSLNGLWKFALARTPKEAPQGFWKQDYDCSRWEDIRVPSPIQLEGHGEPGYQNVAYPWDGHEAIDPGDIPEGFNPTACYVKEFVIPEEAAHRPLFISFQGVESGFALWMNGKYVGYSEDTFTPTEFDLTPYRKAGVNRIAVKNYRWTAGAWLEDQDFFRLSGIFRDVYLFTTPETHLYDLRIRAVPEENLRRAELAVTWNLVLPEGKAPGHAAVRYTLLRAGQTVLTGTASAAEGRKILFGQDATLTAEQMKVGLTGNTSAVHPVSACQITTTDIVEDPALWSAEDPQLYDLKIEVLGSNGTLTEVALEKVGFRRFEMKDGILCLNGKRLVFRGVNRHEFFADSGRTPQPDKIRDDVITMKRANINAIRTCHYPDASVIYRLCDEMGLYMIAENNMETHGVWQAYASGWKDIEYCVPGNRPEYLELVMDRVNSCYQRDKNHPAVLIWSDGNESFSGTDVQAMTDKFHALDPDRLVHYEGISHDPRTPQVSDMYSQMYTPAEKIPEFLREHTDRPLILCEYTHSMGNSNGGMFRYRDLEEREPRFQGGFIWDFVDQAFTRKNRFGEWTQAYGGDFGEHPTDYEFSGNGIVDSLRRPYGKMQEVKFLYQAIRAEVDTDAWTVRIINKNNFVGTDAFDCSARLEREGELLQELPLQTSAAPLSEETCALPLPRPQEPGEYTVTVSFRLRNGTDWASQGYEVAFGQRAFRISGERQIPQADRTGCSAAPAAAFGALRGFAPLQRLTVIRGVEDIGVYGTNFHVLFSLKLCRLVSYVYGGKELIGKCPAPSFWRAPTSNDDGNFMAARQGIWKLASEYADARLTGVEDAYRHVKGMPYPIAMPRIESGEDSFSIGWTTMMPTVPTSAVDITYTVTADGTVRIDMAYEPTPGLPPMPEFGMKLAVDADYNRVTWYGLGPEETYIDREEGGKLGVYSALASEMVQPYLVPQETGNHTGVRWAKVTDRRGRGLLLTAAGGYLGSRSAAAPDGASIMNFSALPWSPEQMEEAKHVWELPRPCYTVIRCAVMQQGVAGDDSWGARTLPQFLVDSGDRIGFSVMMKGI